MMSLGAFSPQCISGNGEWQIRQKTQYKETKCQDFVPSERVGKAYDLFIGTENIHLYIINQNSLPLILQEQIFGFHRRRVFSFTSRFRTPELAVIWFAGEIVVGCQNQEALMVIRVNTKCLLIRKYRSEKGLVRVSKFSPV